jgi:SAM-dependent methyltransferase
VLRHSAAAHPEPGFARALRLTAQGAAIARRVRCLPASTLLVQGRAAPVLIELDKAAAFRASLRLPRYAAMPKRATPWCLPNGPSGCRHAQRRPRLRRTADCAKTRWARLRPINLHCRRRSTRQNPCPDSVAALTSLTVRLRLSKAGLPRFWKVVPLPTWTLNLILTIALTPVAIVLFFYVFTKGALVLRGWRRDTGSAAAHVYPIYSKMWLIRLVDFQPVISAILLFQYPRLVACITDELRGMTLQGQDVLITSCAFGDVIPRVADASFGAGARRLKIVDIIENELVHARSKLRQFSSQVDCTRGDATAMSLPASSVAANVMFFLLHEMNPEMKRKTIAEAMRVLTPGGKLFLAEFHKPDNWLLRGASWLYFKTFEPFGLALWDVQDPVDQLNGIAGVRCQRKTVLSGNFQVIVATKGATA